MQSYLQQQCPYRPELTTIDNSEHVLQAAQDFFGFRIGTHNQVITGDAYRELARLEQEGRRYDFIVVDTLPSPAPPGAIKDAYRALKPGGKLLMNWSGCGAREMSVHRQDFQLFEGGLQQENASDNSVLMGQKSSMPDDFLGQTENISTA